MAIRSRMIGLSWNEWFFGGFIHIFLSIFLLWFNLQPWKAIAFIGVAADICILYYLKLFIIFCCCFLFHVLYKNWNFIGLILGLLVSLCLIQELAFIRGSWTMLQLCYLLKITIILNWTLQSTRGLKIIVSTMSETTKIICRSLIWSNLFITKTARGVCYRSCIRAKFWRWEGRVVVHHRCRLLRIIIKNLPTVIAVGMDKRMYFRGIVLHFLLLAVNSCIIP